MTTWLDVLPDSLVMAKPLSMSARSVWAKAAGLRDRQARVGCPAHNLGKTCGCRLVDYKFTGHTLTYIWTRG
jgi:hypothetical protein